MLNIPFAYIVLMMGYNPNLVIIAMFFVEIICLVARLIFAHHLVGLSYLLIRNELIKPVLFITAISIGISAICIYIHPFFTEYIAFVMSLFVSWSILIIGVMVTMSKSERIMVKSIVSKLVSKIKI